MLTVAQIIDVGKICTTLANNDVINGNLFGARLDPRLPLMLAIETDCVRWQYDQNPDDPTLVGTANYLYSLCGVYLFEALPFIIDNPNNPNNNNMPYLIPVKPGDFKNATEYDNTDIAGQNLKVFFKEIPNYIDNPSQWVYTNTGIKIMIDDFNAANYDPDKDLLIILIYE